MNTTRRDTRGPWSTRTRGGAEPPSILRGAPHSAIPITVIGAGALGSTVTWLLAQLGYRQITVYDFDIVERHNPQNQLYGPAYVGWPKVMALREIIYHRMGLRIATKLERFSGGRLRGIVFVCVDTMATRRAIWEATVRRGRGVTLFVEARLGREGGRIYTVDPHVPRMHRKYEATLYTDAEAADNPCGRQPIAPTVAVVAGHAVSAMLHAVPGTGSEVTVSLHPIVLTEETF